ncbi:MAG: hypothetical protein KA886_00800 [Candidatus Cloacimonetes bacterium]|nr:hypothetical protein [Candidatus Cloacimonadota bacterium]
MMENREERMKQRIKQVESMTYAGTLQWIRPPFSHNTFLCEDFVIRRKTEKFNDCKAASYTVRLTFHKRTLDYKVYPHREGWGFVNDWWKYMEIISSTNEMTRGEKIGFFITRSLYSVRMLAKGLSNAISRKRGKR